VNDLPGILRLSRLAYLTSPTGAAHLATLTPTFTWEAIPGANAYHISISSGSSSVYMDTPSPRFSMTDDSLLDISTYTVRIDPSLESSAGKVQASALGVDNHVVTDVAGTHVVTVSGTVVNETGRTGDRVVFGMGAPTGSTGLQGVQASGQVSTGTGFSLELLKQADCSTDLHQGFVRVFLDVDGTGDPSAPSAFAASQVGLSSCGSTSDVQVVLRPQVTGLYPESGATAVGDAPTASWEAYETTYANVTGKALDMTGKSYVILFQPAASSGGTPLIAYALPGSTTSFNLAAPPSGKVDVLKELVGGTGASAADLRAVAWWQMSVGVLPCPYGDNGQALADFLACLQSLKLGNELSDFAQSPAGLQFSTK